MSKNERRGHKLKRLAYEVAACAGDAMANKMENVANGLLAAADALNHAAEAYLTQQPKGDA